jgi:cupin domain
MKKAIGLLCVVVLVFVVCAMIAWASPAVGVTPTLIGRGTFKPFHIKTGHHSLVEFQAKAKSNLDVVVRTHDYAAHGYTGWHTHPGPVFITVLQGQLTFYEYDDPTCTPKIVSAGQGYVDTGHGHMGVNTTDQPAKDVSVILAPVGLPFRGELPAPAPYCGF